MLLKNILKFIIICIIAFSVLGIISIPSTLIVLAQNCIVLAGNSIEITSTPEPVSMLSSEQGSSIYIVVIVGFSIMLLGYMSGIRNKAKNKRRR